MHYCPNCLAPSDKQLAGPYCWRCDPEFPTPDKPVGVPNIDFKLPKYFWVFAIPLVIVLWLFLLVLTILDAMPYGGSSIYAGLWGALTWVILISAIGLVATKVFAAVFRRRQRKDQMASRAPQDSR